MIPTDLKARVAELEDQLDRLRKDSMQLIGALIFAAGGSIKVSARDRLRSYEVVRQQCPSIDDSETWAVVVRPARVT